MLCDGDERAVGFVTEHLVVGQALGAVDDRVPTVPLEADLIKTCRTLRVRREPEIRGWDLDLRRPVDRARSQLFHRLRLLELDWIVPARSDIQSQGTFRETWASRWRPEYSVPVGRGVGLGDHRRGGGRRPDRTGGTRRQPAGTDPNRRTLPARRAARRARPAAGHPGRAGGPGRRRRAPDGRPAAAGSGPALRRRTPDRHLRAAQGRRDAGGADLHRAAAGRRRAGHRQRHRHAPPDRSGQRQPEPAGRRPAPPIRGCGIAGSPPSPSSRTGRICTACCSAGSSGCCWTPRR